MAESAGGAKEEKKEGKKMVRDKGWIFEKHIWNYAAKRLNENGKEIKRSLV